MRHVARAALAVCLALALPACAGGPPDRDTAPAASGSPAGPPLTASPPDGSPPGDPLADSPLDTCEDLADPPAGAEGTVPEPAAGAGLPDLALPCFTGAEPFTLADLRGPAVVNLWASWCPPCRAELPALQRYADRAGGQVHVLGVVVQDRRSAAASLADDLDLTFPSLDDPDGRTLTEVGAIGLPATLYLDATGQVAHLHQGPLDEDSLARQSADHLGVPDPGAAG